MRNGIWQSLARLVLLLGVLGLLCGLLVWQREAIVQNEKLTHPPQPAVAEPAIDNELGIRLGLPVDPLSERLVKAFASEQQRIIAFRRERRKAMLWPELIVPVPSDLWTNQRVTEEKLKFRLRELDAYRRLTRDSGEAKAAGELFVEDYVRQAAGNRDESDYSRLLKLGTSAIDAGSRDPLLRTFFALVKREMEADYEVAKQTFSQLLTEFPDSGYPQILPFYASCFLYESFRFEGIDDDVAQWKPTVLATVRWLEEERANPQGLRCILSRLWMLWENAPFRNREIFLSALMQSNKVDPYIIHSFAGAYYVELAWQYRGGEFYSKLTSHQKSNFAKYIKIASDHLQYAWMLHPELPYAPSKMITIAMAGSESIETPYFWFVQAVDAQFDYYPAYSAMVYSLLPRWGGSHAKMLLFANNCLSTNRFTTNVPYVVLDVLREMETLEEVTVAESPQASQLLLKFVEARDEYQAAHPDKLLYEHNGAYRANLVQFLEELHQYERVADIFLNASEGMNWTSLRKRMRPAAYLAARLVASPVKFRSQLAEFDEALRQPWNAGKTQDDVEELINRYQKLKEQIPLEGDASAGFIRHVDTILDQLKSYSLGEWVRLPTIDGLPGWEPYCDSWHVLDGDRIELSGRQGDAPQVCLRPLANFHPPLEIEATLEIDVPHRPYSKHVGIGWSREGVEYVHNDRPSTLTSFVIRVSRHNNARANQSNRLEFATILSGPNSPGGGYFLRSEGPHRLRVKLWTHSAEFRVDELTWMVVTMPDGLLPQGWLCFGESSPRGNQSTRLQDTGTMIWSDIRLRRMQLAPPPADSDPLDQQVDYWEKRRSLDPEDLIAWIRVCAVYYQQKRFDDAIRTANEILETAPKINGVHKWKALALLDRDQDYIASLREFELALEEPRDDPESLARSAEIRAAAPDDSLRNVQQAKATAELSIRVTARKHARSFAALATAHAELGDFEEAMKYHRAAMELATDSERNEWEPRQALYEAGQAFRLPSSKTPSLK